MSQQRQVLPGLFYHLPPRQEKRSPLEVEEDEFRQLMQDAPQDAQADKWLLDTFTAISPLWARELAFRAGGSTDCLLRAAQGRLLGGACGLARFGAAGRFPAGDAQTGRQAFDLLLRR